MSRRKTKKPEKYDGKLNMIVRGKYVECLCPSERGKVVPKYPPEQK